MRLVGMLWIFISVLLIALGLSLVVLSALDFRPAPFEIIRIIVGLLCAAGGIILLVFAIKLIFSERTKKSRQKHEVIK